MTYSSWDEHRETLLKKFKNEFLTKYDQGQLTHGGRLWRKPQFGMIKEEVMDLVAYTWTLEDHLTEVRVLLSTALKDQNLDLVEEALNILVYGNPDGKDEEDEDQRRNSR